MQLNIPVQKSINPLFVSGILQGFSLCVSCANLPTSEEVTVT